MKRILVVALTVFVLASSVFAAEVSELDPSINTSLSALTDSSYPHSARSLGMGSAGVAVGGRSDSFYMNPALLARRTLISLPYAQVSLYHPYDLLKKNESTGTSIVDDIMDAMNSGEMTDIAGPATGFLQTIKSGKGKLAEVEAGINLGGGGFALGLHVKDTIHTFGNGVGGLDANLFDELNVNILAALGLRFDITPSISIDVGISSGVSVLGYTQLIGVKEALDVMSKEDPMAALKGKNITIYGDGSQTRSFCYVEDLVEGIILMMNNKNGFTGPVNLGNPSERTVLDLAQKVLELTGSKSKLSFLPLPSDDPVKRKPDISIAKAELGWEPKVDIVDGLKKTIEYFKTV